LRKTSSRPVQYFSKENLERSRKLKTEEILEFLENFRLLHAGTSLPTRLISLKIPGNLLEAFRGKCKLEGVKYQTQIKRLMSDWVQSPSSK